MLSDKINMSYDEWSRAIDQFVVGTNAERNRAIMKRRLLDGICFEPLAEEFQMSVRGIKKVVYKCHEQIVKML